MLSPPSVLTSKCLVYSSSSFSITFMSKSALKCQIIFLSISKSSLIFSFFLLMASIFLILFPFKFFRKCVKIDLFVSSIKFCHRIRCLTWFIKFFISSTEFRLEDFCVQTLNPFNRKLGIISFTKFFIPSIKFGPEIFLLKL